MKEVKECTANKQKLNKHSKRTSKNLKERRKKMCSERKITSSE